MKRLAVVLCACLPLLAGGCDRLAPKISMKVKFVEPCDQKALDSVGTMRVLAEDEEGHTSSNQASRSKGKLTLTDVDISDGTTLFASGYAGDVATDPNALNKEPVTAGAGVPLALETFTKDHAFPKLAARTYPEGGGTGPLGNDAETIHIPVGRVFSFATSTNASNRSCSSMVQGRHGHTATFLGKANKVLIIGGLTYAQDSVSTETFVPKDRAVEVFDPTTGTYEALDTGSMQPLMQRAFHTATALPDGSVLVWGGIGPEGDGTKVSARAISFVLALSEGGSVEIRTLSAAQGFNVKRFHHQATLLRDGSKVVLTGGCGCVGTSLSAAQIKAGMCPAASDTCTTEGTSGAVQARVAAVEVYDVASGSISAANTVLSKPRAFHTATAIDGGLVVIAGGDDGVEPVLAVEVFRSRGPSGPTVLPVTDSLSATNRATRAAAVALSHEECSSILSDHPEDTAGECVLITGGCSVLPAFQVPGGKATEATCAEVRTASTIIDMARASGERIKDGPALLRKRWDHQAFHLDRGNQMVVLVGGRFAEEDAQGAADDPPIAGECLSRSNKTSERGRPFKLPVVMKNPRRRFATAIFPSGQLMVSGGVPPTFDSTVEPASISSGELFFFPFR